MKSETLKNPKRVSKNKAASSHRVQEEQIKQSQQPFFEPDQLPIFVRQNSEQQRAHFSSLSHRFEEDIKKCGELLESLAEGELQISSRAQQLLEYTSNEETSFNSGISFYSCKNLIFNEYLICLKFYQIFRLNGADFSEGAADKLYKRLVFLKTLLLKLSPVEKKLQYQKNKLLKKGEKAKIKVFQNKRPLAENAERQSKLSDEDKEDEEVEVEDSLPDNKEQDEEDDNLAYRPAVKNLLSSQKKNEKSKDLSKQKYIPPKQLAVLTSDEKQKRRLERQKQRRNAFLLRKFRGDIDSGDEAEEKGLLNDMDEKFKKKYEAKVRMEEQNFTRFGETKKQKFWRKQMMKNQFRGQQLNDELKEVEMIRQLVDGEASDQRPRVAEMSAPKPKKHKRT